MLTGMAASNNAPTRCGRPPIRRCKSVSFWLFMLRSWLWLSIISNFAYASESGDGAMPSGNAVKTTIMFVYEFLCWS